VASPDQPGESNRRRGREPDPDRAAYEAEEGEPSAGLISLQPEGLEHVSIVAATDPARRRLSPVNSGSATGRVEALQQPQRVERLPRLGWARRGVLAVEADQRVDELA